MKNNKTNYRLVARMKGDSLTIVREEMSRFNFVKGDTEVQLTDGPANHPHHHNEGEGEE